MNCKISTGNGGGKQQGNSGDHSDHKKHVSRLVGRTAQYRSHQILEQFITFGTMEFGVQYDGGRYDYTLNHTADKRPIDTRSAYT